MLRAWGDRGAQRKAARSADKGTAVLATAYLDPWDALRRELDRGRRYRHPLALIQLAPSGTATRAAAEEEAVPRRRFRRSRDVEGDVIESLRAFLRTGDEVWRVHERVFIMLPEADHAAAAALVERLRTYAPHVLEGIDARLVSFPDDGLTAAALLAALARPRSTRRAAPATRHAGTRESTSPRAKQDSRPPWASRSRGAQP
jgi:hypothetical protein